MLGILATAGAGRSPQLTAVGLVLGLHAEALANQQLEPIELLLKPSLALLEPGYVGLQGGRRP